MRGKVAQALALFRRALPAGELDERDWDCLRVSVRLVYETEDLRVLLRSKRKSDRAMAITYWNDSLESGVEFMSWTRCLASIATDITYPSEPRDGRIENLWEQHRELAKALLAKKLTPARRLSLLVELGGIELCLLGQLWWVKPEREAAIQATSAKRRKKQVSRRAA